MCARSHPWVFCYWSLCAPTPASSVLKLCDLSVRLFFEEMCFPITSTDFLTREKNIVELPFGANDHKVLYAKQSLALKTLVSEERSALEIEPASQSDADGPDYPQQPREDTSAASG